MSLSYSLLRIVSTCGIGIGCHWLSFAAVSTGDER